MRPGAIMGGVLADHDFHPDEPTVRIFRTPPAGVLRLDDGVAVSEADYHGTVLRHYAFAGRWLSRRSPPRSRKLSMTRASRSSLEPKSCPCGVIPRAVRSR
jgi:hypothetical protein